MNAVRVAGVRVAGVLVSGLLVALGLAVLQAPAGAEPTVVPTVGGVRAKPKGVLERVVYGRSVKKRPLVAYHLGDPEARRTVLLIAGMHGNEPRPQKLLTTLRDGPVIAGIDLWVVPKYNPDGLAKHTRKNARGVDLNRNHPLGWVNLGGKYESGRAPASEPETQAMMAFLKQIQPDRILSFHQPLHSVDLDTKLPGFAKQVAKALGLPVSRLTCGGVCHGTMTDWFNHKFDGAALTVELGSRPAKRMLTRSGPKALLGLFGARFDTKNWQPAR